MSSSNRRERELARRKRDRQLSRATGKSSRNTNILIYSVIAVVVGVVSWAMLAGGTPSASPSLSESPTPTQSSWCEPAPTPVTAPTVFDSPGDEKISGKYTWTLTTNCGDVVIELDGDKAPSTVRSYKFLSSKKWLDKTPCHRITTESIFVLQCGDPTAAGTGGPGYEIPDENLPKAVANNYPAGTVAMAEAQGGLPGSQFFIVYDDTTLDPNYTIFGKVTKGLDIVQHIAADGAYGGAADGIPATPIGILESTVKKAGS